MQEYIITRVNVPVDWHWIPKLSIDSHLWLDSIVCQEMNFHIPVVLAGCDLNNNRIACLGKMKARKGSL